MHTDRTRELLSTLYYELYTMKLDVADHPDDKERMQGILDHLDATYTAVGEALYDS